LELCRINIDHLPLTLGCLCLGVLLGVGPPLNFGELSFSTSSSYLIE
jgi:hypothetical protein